jgi:hypothetical protein
VPSADTRTTARPSSAARATASPAQGFSASMNSLPSGYGELPSIARSMASFITRIAGDAPFWLTIGSNSRGSPRTSHPLRRARQHPFAKGTAMEDLRRSLAAASRVAMALVDFVRSVVDAELRKTCSWSLRRPALST